MIASYHLNVSSSASCSEISEVTSSWRHADGSRLLVACTERNYIRLQRRRRENCITRNVIGEHAPQQSQQLSNKYNCLSSFDHSVYDCCDWPAEGHSDQSRLANSAAVPMVKVGDVKMQIYGTPFLPILSLPLCIFFLRHLSRGKIIRTVLFTVVLLHFVALCCTFCIFLHISLLYSVISLVLASGNGRPASMDVIYAHSGSPPQCTLLFCIYCWECFWK